MTAPRTLFIHAGALGDFVLTLSLVQVIAESQSAPVTMLARGEFAPIAALCPHIDRTIDINASPWHKLFGDEPQDAINAIAAIDCFDFVVDAMGISETSREALTKVGVKQHIQYDPRAIPGDNRHITEQWTSKIDSEGLSLPRLRPVSLRSIPRLNESNSSHAINPTNRPTPNRTTVMHVGSGGRAKCWPIEQFIELAELTRAEGHHILFPLGDAETERTDIITNRHRLSAVGTIVDSPSLTELIEIIQRSTLYIGNDSGPTHLAAALGRPTVALFGPTNPTIWSPRGNRTFVVNCTNTDSQLEWPRADRVLQVANRVLG